MPKKKLDPEALEEAFKVFSSSNECKEHYLTLNIQISTSKLTIISISVNLA